MYTTRIPNFIDENRLEMAINCKIHVGWVLKRRTDGGAGCTEDGRDGQIRATEYAGGNRTRKRGGSAGRSEEKVHQQTLEIRVVAIVS